MLVILKTYHLGGTLYLIRVECKFIEELDIKRKMANFIFNQSGM